MGNMFIGYSEEVYVGKKLISCKLIWGDSLIMSVEKIMNGETILVYDKVLLDGIIKGLEGREHLGIVLTGCSPWHVSVVFPDKLKYKDLKVGKYYKILSKNERDCSDSSDSYASRVSLNNSIVYVEDRLDTTYTWTFIRTSDGLMIGSKYGLWTYLDSYDVYFIEVEKPKDFNLEFVGKKIVYYKDFETGCYYKCLDKENKYYNQILYVGHTDYYFLTTFGEDDFIYNDMPFIKIEPNWIDV